MKKNKSKISGLSILEALVSTAIVGIGFIAILQMTNFSAQSIDNSGDRTKANYLTEMIAEDVIGSKNTLYGVNSDNENIVFNNDCLLYTSPSPRDQRGSRMPSSA